MKKKRFKWLSIFLIIALILSISIPVNLGTNTVVAVEEDATVVDSGSCGSNATWTLYSDGLLEIKGAGNLYSANPEYNSYAVWNRHRGSIKTVVIKAGITSIGDFNFWDCENLESITLPATVTSIGDSAFSLCGKLASIELPKQLTYIGKNAFWECDSLTSVTLPDSVTYIGTSAFGNCDNLEVVPGICGSNGEFHWYFNQKTGEISFEGEGNLPSYNPTYNIYAPWNTYRSSIKSVTIPEGITGIGAHNFWWCENLESVSLPSTITSIGDLAFHGCDKLVSFELPASVKTLGNYAIAGCVSLTTIKLPEGLETIGNNCFADNPSLTDITIPSTVKSLGAEAFRACTSLKSIEIPESVTALNAKTFNGCTSLTDVTLPDTLTSLEDAVFEDCTALAEITLPDGLLTLRNDVFKNCVNLKEIVLPDSVNYLGMSVFSGCTSLSNITVPDGVEYILNYTFENCTGLKKVNLPDSVTTIYTYAFTGCTGLTELELPAELTEIGTGAFYNCTGISSFEIPEKVTTIGPYAFQYTPITEISIPASVEEVSAYAFMDTDNLKKVYIYNPSCDLQNGSFVGDGLTMYGYTGSTAEAYADLYGYEFVSLGKANIENFDAEVINYYQRTYDGNPKTPIISVAGLAQEEDFTVSYVNNVNAGTATAIVSGINDFTGTMNVTFEILPADIDNVTMSLDITEMDYGPEVTQPNVIVEGLTKDVDYTVTYGANSFIEGIPVGTAYATITGINNYTDERKLYYTVNARDISSLPGELEFTEVTYSNDTIDRPDVVMRYDASKDDLLNSSYLDITYSPNYVTSVGTVTVTVKGKSPVYTGTRTFTYEVVPQSLTELADKVKIEQNIYYDGTEKKPKVTVYGDKTYPVLEENVHYTLEYVNNINAGTATVKIKGIGNYCDTIEKNFEISLKTLDSWNISHYDYNHYYDGKPHSITMRNVPSFATVTYATSEDGPYSVDPITRTEIGTTVVYYKVSAEGYKDFLGSGSINIMEKPHTCTFITYVPDGNATCVKDGTKTAKCEGCDKTYTLPDLGSALGHNYKTVVTAPSCTEDGYSTHTCTRCADSYIDTYKYAQGHKTTLVNAKTATCSAEGYTGDQVCSVCKVTVTRGAAIAKAEHSWDNGTITTQATPSKPGVKTFKCTRCKTTRTEAVTYVGVDVERIWGASRYKTSLAIADELKAELGVSKFSTVIIANGANFPDALAGSYLAAKKDAPILMVNPKGDNSIVQTYIERNLVSKGKVYILGGTAAVPQNVEDNLKAKGYDVERLKGAGRYDTNLEILKEAGVTNEAILVCTGTNFADSLSASAAGLPILLVDPNSQKLSAAQIDFLDDAKREIYIIGGTGAVSDTYLNALKKYDSNNSVERVKGKSRYETSVEVAKKFCGNPSEAVIASATNFPDGLCGGPLAYFMDAPLILTGANTAPAADYVDDKNISSGKALGGTGALAEDVVRTVFGMKADEKISGTRYE